MAGPSGGAFGDDFMSSFFGGAPGPSGSKREEKGLPWEAKVIDGAFYVPLKQVGELLKQNNVLPKVRAGIERRVEAGPPKKSS